MPDKLCDERSEESQYGINKLLKPSKPYWSICMRILEYYEKNTKEPKKAKCTICVKKFDHGTTTSNIQHNTHLWARACACYTRIGQAGLASHVK